jgi:hypothetical protein
MRNILEKIRSVSNQDLNSIDTGNINKCKMYGNTECYHGMSGREHYRLLMYISTLFNDNVLFDVGTNECRSAIALSYNNNNKIKSFDIIQINPENPVIENVEFILGDSTKDKNIHTTPFIFLDVDHDGTYENIFYSFLKESKWKGLLMLDDIHLNDAMKNFWNKIEEEKYDLTSIGHWSGTGVVLFE